MTHASTFSGIGGFDLAAEYVGWDNLFNCEIDEYCRKILKKHFPNTIQYADITKTDFSIHRGRVNVLSGGFPCQDTSVASSNGKAGLNGKSSGLWFEMLRAVDELSPDWVVCENVYGLINQDGGMALESIISGMESKGYEVFPPIIIPAIATGANHIRKRVWIIAHATGIRNGIQASEIQTGRNIPQHSDWWSSEPAIPRVHDGVSPGLDKRRIKALGNSIRVQIAINIFKTISAYAQLPSPPITEK